MERAMIIGIAVFLGWLALPTGFNTGTANHFPPLRNAKYQEYKDSRGIPVNIAHHAVAQQTINIQ
jgi:hypothetical protein